jgi:hypothetical protein
VSELLFDFSRENLYISAFAHVLGALQNNLEDLARDGLLASSVASLEQIGYRYNRSAEPGTKLVDFAAGVFKKLFEECGSPDALVVHHSYSVNTYDPFPAGSRELLARAKYFPSSLLRHFQLDHVPYWGSYTSGCTGFMSLLAVGSGMLRATAVNNVTCLTADLKPPHTTFDGVQEKLLTSDAASGFVVSRRRGAYQVLAIGQYSSSREIVPWLEVVKRAVQMTRQLCGLIGISCDGASILCHYPNMFVDAWQLVSYMLKVPKENQIIDGMAERAHCLSSDSVISLDKYKGSNPGRVHAVYSFGSGLHLAITILQEI